MGKCDRMTLNLYKNIDFAQACLRHVAGSADDIMLQLFLSF
jgi:hypothetical protein